MPLVLVFVFGVHIQDALTSPHALFYAHTFPDLHYADSKWNSQ